MIQSFGRSVYKETNVNECRVEVEEDACRPTCAYQTLTRGLGGEAREAKVNCRTRTSVLIAFSRVASDQRRRGSGISRSTERYVDCSTSNKISFSTSDVHLPLLIEAR